jgi:hypothetical protein
MSQSKNHSLTHFVKCFQKVPDPRSKRGVSQPFATILAITFLGLIANVNTPAEIARWAKLHFKTLKTFLRFGKTRNGKESAPCDNTFTRVWRKLSYDDLQNAFAEFLNAILGDTALIGAVDGKIAKQTKDKDGNPILMLNVFAHKLKLHLASWDVRGDKTNEPGCLQKHLEELFTMYPGLKLLTGDAIYAQRPLIKAIREHHRDYLFQVKDNQPKVLAKLEASFKDAPQQEPDDCVEIIVDDAQPQKPPQRKVKSYDRKVNKKRGLWRCVACG